jgi:hypothetical protein
MCTVSMIGDWGHLWTSPPYPLTPPQTITPPAPGIYWTLEMFQQFMKLLERVRKLEEEHGVPNCEDPEKLKWIDDIRRTLAGETPDG